MRSNVDVCFGGGVLNPQPLDSLVHTPYGFKRMGDIRVGDVVSTVDGGIQQVLAVIDKGVLSCVEFTLDDGRKVRSALTHTWQVKERHGYIRNVAAQDIINYINKSEYKTKQHQDKLRIPVVSPVKIVEVSSVTQRSIHPYLLGCLLGDGCLSAHLYRADLGTTDIEIVDRIKELGYDIVKESSNPDSLHYCIRNKEVVEYLKDLGLWGHLSYTKFIPDCYKYAPVKDRLELLKGLFDTDGCCSKTKNKNPRVSYRTVSKRLALDIQELIWSLGGKCSIHITPACVRLQNGKKVNCAESYGLLAWLKDDKDFFYLKRKKDRAITDAERKSKLYVGIKSYKIVKPCEMRCISVSGEDHLYITDGYIRTHNCGKTFASVLSTAECSLDPEFRAVFIRKTFTEITSGGGMYDEFRTIYGDWASYKQSQPPRVTFPSGAYVEFRQVNNEDLKKIQEEWKGSQYTMIYIDEATSVAFSTFKYLMSRNRSKSRFHPTIKATMNPERECWIRPFIDWYVGPDGKIIPERDGRVRYFFIYGNDPTDVFWGNTKEEVYRQGKSEIDRKLRALGGDFTYENLIKSFVFYLGKMSENKASIGNNMDYAGSVASVGGHQAEQFIEGNWNASSRDESTYVVKPSTINALPNRERATNGMKYITVDLADTGSNSTVICVFDGFHLLDMEILNRSTPRGNAERVKAVARRHDIADSHIIYDAQRAAYMIDYIPEAVPYYSFSPSRGIYTRREYKRRKDENYARLIEAVNNGYFSIEPSVADKIFEQTKTGAKTVLQKMCEEGSVILWADDSVSGKKRLATKKEMNSKLGKGESMDIWDACHMLMSAYEQYEFGAELTAGREAVAEEARMYDSDFCDIYDDSTWA